jgi:cobalt-zinc-cadmium efflux system membrane fusion protein
MRTAHRAWHWIGLSAATFGSITVLTLCGAGCSGGVPQSTAAAAAAAATAAPLDGVELSASQLQAVKVAAIGTRSFALQRSAVGTIGFDENVAVQVFSPYAGRIIRSFVEVGDDVRRGTTLYTIDSPDLLQAESTLIAAAGVAELTSATLARAKDLFDHQGLAQKDYQQAVSDQMAAEGALSAARDAVRIFGKSEHEIDAIVAQRKVDSTLVIPSPVTGRITARFAQPGLLVQPGAVPAPYAVADVSALWMLANVPESDVALLGVGQAVDVRIMALGNRLFKASIKTIGATIDPTTHTVVVRSEVHDPQHQLRPGMMATFVVRVGDDAESVAIPVDGVVREGDGTMSAWVTTDRQKFVRRNVKIGLQQDGFDQILEGVKPGEQVVVDGAILLSNMFFGGGGGD